MSKTARLMKDSGIEWIGEIPVGWEVARLWSQFTFGKGLPITKADLVEQGQPVISYGQIHSKKNNGVEVSSSLIRYVPEEYISKNPESLVNEGDFIFADTSEDFDGCGNCAYIDRRISLFAGYHTIILHHRENQKNKFLAYLFLTDNWRSQIRSRVSGVKVYSISQKILKGTNIILPPLPEQQKIADYLDEKCGKIDLAIAKSEEIIEKLKAYKLSLITETVTKGLDPNAPMKDSGIEWIGEIPRGWEIDKSNRIFQIIGSGTTPKSGDAAFYDGGISWIQSGDINGSFLNETKATVTEEALNTFSALKIYQAPFIVIAMYGASIGNLSLSQINACVNQACCVMQTTRFDLMYFFYVLKTAKDYLIWKADGGGQPNISQDKIKQLWLPLPPLPEQQKIADYLDAKCAAIDKNIADRQTLIEKLTAYKKSLIYEAVTGKKEI